VKGKPVDSFVTLAGREPFARGGKRACYLHPEHSGLCIKLPLPEQLPEDLYRAAPWHERLRKSVSHFDENDREWVAAQWMERHRGRTIWTHVPRYHGWIETDLGRGLLTEVCRDDDGLISRSLLDYLWTHGHTDSVKRAIDDFSEFWVREGVPAHNFILNNLVCQKQADGRLRIWVVDGLGSRTLIPLCRWCKPVARRDARNRIAYLHLRIQQVLKRIESGTKPHNNNGFLLSRA
jgi:hypothetical protein